MSNQRISVFKSHTGFNLLRQLRIKSFYFEETKCHRMSAGPVVPGKSIHNVKIAGGRWFTPCNIFSEKTHHKPLSVNAQQLLVNRVWETCLRSIARLLLESKHHVGICSPSGTWSYQAPQWCPGLVADWQAQQSDPTTNAALVNTWSRCGSNYLELVSQWLQNVLSGHARPPNLKATTSEKNMSQWPPNCAIRSSGTLHLDNIGTTKKSCLLPTHLMAILHAHMHVHDWVFPPTYEGNYLQSYS